MNTHYKSSETNEKDKRQTKYSITHTPIDLIISKTAMLFITNFKSTNEVKQASKAVGSTAVETMVTEDAVGCILESKDFGGLGGLRGGPRRQPETSWRNR